MPKYILQGMKFKMSKNSEKINKRFKVTLIIFIIVALITLAIILCKGKIFGFRLVALSGAEASASHSIQVVADNYNLSVDGGETDIYVTVDGSDVTDGYELTSSDESVATIEDNKIVAVSEGTTKITAKSTEYDVQSEITINVVELITKLTVSSEFKTIKVGEQTQMSYTTTPKNSTVSVKYASSDETIATVDTNGIVTGVKAGSVSIIVTDEISGKSASYTIKVKA